MTPGKVGLTVACHSLWFANVWLYVSWFGWAGWWFVAFAYLLMHTWGGPRCWREDEKAGE